MLFSIIIIIIILLLEILLSLMLITAHTKKESNYFSQLTNWIAEGARGGWGGWVGLSTSQSKRCTKYTQQHYSHISGGEEEWDSSASKPPDLKSTSASGFHQDLAKEKKKKGQGHHTILDKS